MLVTTRRMPHGNAAASVRPETAPCHLRSQDCAAAVRPVPVFLVKPVAVYSKTNTHCVKG